MYLARKGSEGIALDEFVRFLGVMSALSASAQTMTHQIRKRFHWLQLEEKVVVKDEKVSVDPDEKRDLVELKEGKLHANVHLACGVNGFILAALGNIHPLQYLGLNPIWAYAKSPLVANGLDYLCAGVLVAYGGPWFHEVLGIMREYKKTLRGKA